MACGPAVVHNHVFDPLRGGEVDVILIGLGIDSGTEVHARDVPGVPPIPSHLAGPNPRRVVDLRGLGEQPAQIARGETGIRTHHGDAPRKRARALDPGDVISPLLDEDLDIIIAAGLAPQRIRSETPLQRSAAVAVVEVHARVIVEIRLGEADVHPVVRMHHGRQEDQTAGVELRERRFGIYILERVVPLGIDRTRIVAHVRNCYRAIGRKAVVGLLRGDLERILRSSGEAVRDTVVVNAKLHRPVVPHLQRETVIMVANRRGAVKRRGKHGVGTRANGFRYAGRRTPHAAVGELQTDRGWLH